MGVNQKRMQFRKQRVQDREEAKEFSGSQGGKSQDSIYEGYYRTTGQAWSRTQKPARRICLEK